MVGDITEENQLLSKAVKNACAKKKETKNIEKDVQSYHVESIEMSALNETIHSYVKSDVSDNQHEKEENMLNKRLKNKDIESIKTGEHASDNQQSSNSEGDSQSNFYPEESDFYETSSSDEGSVASNFEDWYNNQRARHKGKHKSYSD